MTQDEILDRLEDQREQLLDAIEGLSEELMLEPGVVGSWSIKDLLAHLSAWEAELLRLLWQAQQGEKPATLHFSQKDVDEENAILTQLHQDRPLERVLADFEAVRKQTSRRVLAFSDPDLNNPQRFPWLKNEPLWQWIANDSFDHEAEHMAQILAWRSSKGL